MWKTLKLPNVVESFGLSYDDQKKNKHFAFVFS